MAFDFVKELCNKFFCLSNYAYKFFLKKERCFSLALFSTPMCSATWLVDI